MWFIIAPAWKLEICRQSVAYLGTSIVVNRPVRRSSLNGVVTSPSRTSALVNYSCVCEIVLGLINMHGITYILTWTVLYDALCYDKFSHNFQYLIDWSPVTFLKMLIKVTYLFQPSVCLCHVLKNLFVRLCFIDIRITDLLSGWAAYTCDAIWLKRYFSMQTILEYFVSTSCGIFRNIVFRVWSKCSTIWCEEKYVKKSLLITP